MSQEAATVTVEAPSPWPKPPLCTRPDILHCPDRYLRHDAPERVCRASEPCKGFPQRAPAAWSGADVEVLRKNSHLDVGTLQRLLGGYYTVNEVRAKLEEVDP